MKLLLHIEQHEAALGGLFAQAIDDMPSEISIDIGSFFADAPMTPIELPYPMKSKVSKPQGQNGTPRNGTPED